MTQPLQIIKQTAITKRQLTERGCVEGQRNCVAEKRVSVDKSADEISPRHWQKNIGK